MAIKFGDLIENVNADRAVIDLIDNNAKGLLFVTDFDDNTGTAANNGVAGIPEELRAPGSIVLDKTDGILYAWPGTTNGTITEEVSAGSTATPGAWDDVAAATTDWVQIGKVDKREAVLVANISAGPETIDSAFVGNSNANLLTHVNTLRQKLNEIINNPPRSFGKFLSNEEVVTSTDLPAGLSALRIIERALSQMQSYSVVLTATSGSLENQQATGTNTFSLTVDSPNFNLLNDSQENIEPTAFRLFFRQQGETVFTEASATDVQFAADDFTSSSSTATKTLSHDFTVTGSLASFSGFEYKVEIRDNSEEGDLPGADLAAVAGSPVRGISNIVSINEAPYAPATSSLSITATNSESAAADYGQPDNCSNILRSKRNHGTEVTWSLSPNAANAGPNDVIAISGYEVQMRVRTNGDYGEYGAVPTSSVTNHNPSATGNFTTTRSGSFTLNTSSLNNNTVDGIQFRIVYSDAVVTDSQTTQSSEVKFRFPILAGFLNVGTTPIISNFGDFTNLTQTTLKTMTLRPGGWNANATDVPGSYTAGASYGNTFDSEQFFPRLDPNYGYNQSGDNATPNYNTNSNMFAGTSNGTASDGAFGWVHNSQTTPAPDSFPDALQGAANTRFIVAVPDGGTGTSNLGLAVIETIGNGAGTTSGTVFGEVAITNSFGATKVYVVSVQGSIESMNSAAGTKTPFLIKSLG